VADGAAAAAVLLVARCLAPPASKLALPWAPHLTARRAACAMVSAPTRCCWAPTHPPGNTQQLPWRRPMASLWRIPPPAVLATPCTSATSRWVPCMYVCLVISCWKRSPLRTERYHWQHGACYQLPPPLRDLVLPCPAPHCTATCHCRPAGVDSEGFQGLSSRGDHCRVLDDVHRWVG
jgi:hypothetical protein